MIGKGVQHPGGELTLEPTQETIGGSCLDQQGRIHPISHPKPAVMVGEKEAGKTDPFLVKECAEESPTEEKPFQRLTPTVVPP